MAYDVNTFPLVISASEDGQLTATINGFETLVAAAADRSARAFQRAGRTADASFSLDGARRDIDKFAASVAAFQTRAAERGADPLGIRASLQGLSASPLQKIISEQASAESALAQQRAKASAERVAAIQREFDAAIAAIGAEKAARADAFATAEKQGNALIALQQQQIAEAAKLVAAPSQAPSALYFDPKGAQAAAASARAYAQELDVLAGAAQRVVATGDNVTENERALALTLRNSADAADLEADRLNGLAFAQKRVSDEAVLAGGKFSAAGGLIEASQRRTRFATLQAGQQFSDFFIQLQTGTNPIIAFTQQASQLGFVLEGSKGIAGKFATFMNGPYGIALTAAAAVSTLLASSLFDAADAAQKANDASLTLEAALSQQKFATDEVRKAIDEYNRAQKKAEATDSLAAESALRLAKGRLQEAIATRIALQATVEKLRADEASARFVGGGQLLPAIDQAGGVLSSNATTIKDLQQTIRNLNIEVATNTSKGVADASKRINDFYDRLADKAKRAARGNNELNASIGATLNGIEKRRAADLGAESEKSRNDRSSKAIVNRQASQRSQAGQRRQELFADAAAIGDGTDAIKAANSTYAAEITRLKNQLREGLISDGAAKDAYIKARQIRNAAVEAAQGAKTLDEALQRIGQEFDGESRFVDRIQAARNAIAKAQNAIGTEGFGTIGANVYDTANLDKISAGVEAAYVKPITDANRALQDQLAIQAQILAGNGPEADFLRLKQQILQSYGDLADDERARLEAQIEPLRDLLDAERQRTLEIERRNQLIDIQVRAAQALQSAFTDFLTNPTGSGLADFSKALADSRKRQVAQTLSVKLLGDLGQKKRDELNGYAPLNVSASKMNDAAAAHLAAAKSIAAAAGQLGAANDNAALPSSAIAGGSIKVAALAPAIGAALKASQPSIASDESLFDGLARVLGRPAKDLKSAAGDLAEVNAENRRGGDLRDSAILTLASTFTGGKLGNLISAYQNTKGFEEIGGRISKEIGGTLGDVLGSAAAGLGAGQTVAAGFDLLGIKGAGTGAQIGGLVAGPIGAVVGGIIGALFYKPKYATASLSGPDSAPVVAGSNADYKRAATTLGGTVQSSIQQIADTFGAAVGNYAVSIGTFDGRYRVSTTGFTGSLNNRDARGQGLVDFGKDGQQDAIEFAIRDAISDGAVQGIRAGTKALILAGKDLNTQLQKAVSFENVFIELKQYNDPVGAAIDALDKQFGILRRTFREAGATTQEYSDLEALYAIKRAEAVKQASAQLTATLQNLFDDLRYKGDNGLSLRTRESGAAAAFAPLAAQIRAGQKVDQDKFAEAARTYLDISREIYGSTANYFARLSDVTGLTSLAIANATRGTTLADGAVAPPDGTLAAANDNSSIGATIAAALRDQATVLAIGDDRVAQFTQNQLANTIYQAMTAQSQAPAPNFTLQSESAEMIAAVKEQTAETAQQTQALTRQFELLIATTATIRGGGGGRFADFAPELQGGPAYATLRNA